MRYILLYLGVLIICTVINGCANETIKTHIRPQNFVDLQQVIPNIYLDIRYATHFNFIGEPIDGYRKPKCLLTRKTAQALVLIQRELNDNRLALKVYDCYRPQRAVNQFVRWARDLTDTRMKSTFYPNVDKKNLFKQGYIASKSGHSRGSTLDLTIITMTDGQQELNAHNLPPRDNSLEMGTPYDFFDPLSHTINQQLKGNSLNNRLMLKAAMEKHGFSNLPEEWWHYTLREEPYPETYFDFPVE